MSSKCAIWGCTATTMAIIAGMLWANQPEPVPAPQAPATRPARVTTRPTTRPSTRPATRPVYRDIRVEEFDRLLREKKYPVLDVRTKAEFDAAHIPGAINIDVNDPQFATKVAALAKDKTYLVNCRSGVRSARACDKMSAIGFNELYNLEGGIIAWQKAKKDVTAAAAK